MLISLYPPAYSGAGTQAEHLVRALVAQGAEMKVLGSLPRGSDAQRCERSTNLEVRRFPVPGIDEKRRLVFGLRAAWWLLTRSDWDVLHVQGFSYWGVLPIAVARLKRRPILVKTTLLGPDRPRHPARSIAAAYRGIDAIVALSDELERSFREDPEFRARLLRIPNGVDTACFHPADLEARRAARRVFELPPDALVIVTAGDLDRRKNVVSLVDAVGRLPQRPVCVALAGPPASDPSYRAELEQAIDALPVGVTARLVGRLDPSRLADLLRAADIFALTSRYEGLPNSLLEGMATGLACVATDVAGSRDVLSEGGGLLVPLEDGDALVGALETLAGNPAERERLGREALAIIERGYSLSNVAERYLEVYRSLIQ
jgi:glycosyltransferase involved in cell wall biosynthesis